MNIHDPWTQLHIFSASESLEGKSDPFACLLCSLWFAVLYSDNQELQAAVLLLSNAFYSIAHLMNGWNLKYTVSFFPGILSHEDLYVCSILVRLADK